MVVEEKEEEGEEKEGGRGGRMREKERENV